MQQKKKKKKKKKKKAKRHHSCTVDIFVSFTLRGFSKARESLEPSLSAPKKLFRATLSIVPYITNRKNCCIIRRDNKSRIQCHHE